MGKKYIIELEDNEFVYKTIIKKKMHPMLQVFELLSPTPYTEPDLEQVRKEAYDKGYDDATAEIGSDEQAIADKAYQKGLSDAWEAAKKIALMDTETSESITGYFGLHNIMHNLTAAEAIEKLKAYEQKQKEKGLEQKEIKVGDEVEWMGDKYVVIYVMCEAKKADLISCKFGSTRENVAFSALGKTGRYFPEIAEVLRKMKEKDNG